MKKTILLPPAPCAVCGKTVPYPTKYPTRHARCQSGKPGGKGPRRSVVVDQPNPATSPKSLEVEASLPEALRSTYRALVEDYAFSCAKRLGRGYVFFQALADLVVAGWRRP